MNFSGLASKTLVLLVRLYQYTLRPALSGQCRFHPHCSAYAIGALQTHGAIRGVWLTIRRVLRCNPWHPGGIDDVPPRSVRRSGGQRPSPVQGPT